MTVKELSKDKVKPVLPRLQIGFLWADRPGRQSVYVTPEVAKKWLEYNNNVRRLIPSSVQNLEALMNNNEFQNNHPDPIIFNSKGELVNGQNRLTAISNSGKAFYMYVWTGVTEELLKHIDCGVTRKLSNRVSLSSDSSRNVRITRMIISWVSSIHNTNVKLTPDQATEFYNEHKEALNYVDSILGSNVKGLTRTVVLSTLCEYYEKNPDKAKEFIPAMFKFDSEIQQSRYLRDHLLTKSYPSDSTSNKILRRKVISACKAHMENKKLERLIQSDW